MKVLTRVAIAIAVTAAAPFAFANTGTINFTGSLTAATCTVAPGAGAGGSAQNIDVAMGNVSLADLSTGTGSGFATSASFAIEVNCASGMTGLTTVRMAFDPRSGSGLDAQDSRLLRLTGSGTAGVASGVGIGLITENNAVVNLSGASTVEAPLTVTGAAAIARLNLRAAYIATNATPTAGTGDATLPFTLTYE